MRFSFRAPVLLAIVLFVGCADGVMDPSAEQFTPALDVVEPGEGCGEASTVPLLAGQTIGAGVVSVWNDADNVYVRYTTSDGWMLEETHVAVALDMNGIPSNKSGNPVVGKFPYATTYGDGVTETTYTISLAEVGATSASELFVAAHAVVSQQSGGSETAWGQGTRFEDQGNWGMYFQVTVGECGDGGGDVISF